jgi:hypothetical protein
LERRHPARGLPIGLLAPYASIHCFKRLNPRSYPARASRLSQARAQRGTLIPFGQTLIVTAGAGWVQLEGGPIQDIHPGDVVWFAPGEKHWHGATSTTAMTHIAIQEKLDGEVVDWMEHVTDEEYLKAR